MRRLSNLCVGCSLSITQVKQALFFYLMHQRLSNLLLSCSEQQMNFHRLIWLARNLRIYLQRNHGLGRPQGRGSEGTQPEAKCVWASRIFVAECEALRNIRHRNLIKVPTSSLGVDFLGNDFKPLVFELLHPYYKNVRGKEWQKSVFFV